MMVDRVSWLRRVQAHIRREAVFLPKRLVVITLLLFVLYIVLVIRTERNILYAHIGFIEASLKSKLVADYNVGKRPPVPFAPLRLDLIKAKIQDENPYASASELAALVQTAVAAAAAPIVMATPTPPFRAQVVINAAIVLQANLPPDNPTLTVDSARMPPTDTTPDLLTPVTAPSGGGVTAWRPQFPAPSRPPDKAHETNRQVIVAATLIPTSASPTVAATPSTDPQATVLVVALAPSTPGLTAGQTRPNQVLVSPSAATGTPAMHALPSPPALPPMTPTDSTVPATHLAAAHPDVVDTPTRTPTFVSLLGLAVTVTSIPSATWTPLPPTPLPTATMTPLSTPTAVPTLAYTAPTALATAPVLTLAPATATATPTLLPTATPTALPTSLPTPTVLPTIGNLTARMENGKVFLAWPPLSGAGIVGYNLYRGHTTVGGVAERMNTVPLPDSAYVDTVPLDGNQYFYLVTAVDQSNQESLPSQAVMVTAEDRIPPRTPRNFSVNLNGNQIQLAWQANEEQDLAGYNIYRSTHLPIDRTQARLNGATLLTVPAYEDTVVLNGETYYYVFTAVDLAGNESLPSIEAQVPTIDWEAPLPPTGLRATFHDDEAKVEWQANGEADVVGYRLYRAHTLPIDPGGPPLHDSPLLSALTYSDQSLEQGKTYYYVIVAVDAAQNVSMPSATVALTIPQ